MRGYRGPPRGRRGGDGRGDTAGGEALFVRTDVAQEAEVEALVHHTVATYERLDYAFNNAAGTGGGGPLHRLAEEDWVRILGVCP
jgi:NAD(P)-dependent dehydrogenase (short-subunit alcohol dehydrogenase family)